MNETHKLPNPHASSLSLSLSFSFFLSLSLSHSFFLSLSLSLSLAAHLQLVVRLLLREPFDCKGLDRHISPVVARAIHPPKPTLMMKGTRGNESDDNIMAIIIKFGG